jgi:hypothetical protein
MGLLDKVKSQAEQAAVKAKEGVQELQLKRELGQAHEELGKLTVELADAGELTHDRLAPLVAKVHELQAKLEDDAPAEQPAGAESTTSG